MKPKLWVYITHFQPNNYEKSYELRLNYLATSVFYLSQILNFQIILKIVSNRKIDSIFEISAPINARIDGSVVSEYVASDTEYLAAAGRRLDWLLTWVHKPLMRKDLENSNSNSGDIFLVLEDDALFTSANLEYFLQEFAGVKEEGLIPSFIRSEWSTLDRRWTHEDPIGRITSTAKFFPHPADSRKVLMQLANPFSASIISDYELANEYFKSESAIQELACYKHPVIYDIGSSACLGLIMEKFPPGYLCRVAVICNSENNYPLPGSVIRHLGDKYAQDKWHRNIRLYDSDSYDEVPTHRSVKDYVRRLLRKDVISVLRKKLISKKT